MLKKYKNQHSHGWPWPLHSPPLTCLVSSAALGTGGGLPPALLLLSPAGRVDPAALLPPFAAVVVVVDPLHVLPAGACDLVGEICPTYIGRRYSGQKVSHSIRREFLRRTAEKMQSKLGISILQSMLCIFFCSPFLLPSLVLFFLLLSIMSSLLDTFPAHTFCKVYFAFCPFPFSPLPPPFHPFPYPLYLLFTILSSVFQ